jgi:hypothetical protein
VADLAIVFHEPHFGDHHAVFDLLVTAGTIDLSFGHVGIMHESYIFIFSQPFGLIVTGVAAFLRSPAFSLDDIPMALFTGDMAGPHKIQVVESKPLELDILPGNLMAGRAIPQGKMSDLPFGLLEVAEIASGVGHFDVGPHHNLGVAARATQLLAPPQVAQVELMIEADPFFESDLAGQDICGMAAHPQATGVFNLGVGFGAVFLGYVLNHRVNGLEFGPHGFPRLRGIMAVHAGYLIVFGSLPGFIIRLHNMAAVAERGAGAVEKQGGKKDK